MERSGFVGLCEEIIGTHVWVVAGIQKLGWVKPCHPLEITNCWRPTKMSIDGIKEPQAGYRTRPWVTPEHFYCYRYRWPQIENSIIWPDQRCFCVIRSESWETELKQRELDIIFNVLCSCRTRQRYTWRPTRTDLWKHRGKRIDEAHRLVRLTHATLRIPYRHNFQLQRLPRLCGNWWHSVIPLPKDSTRHFSVYSGNI